MGRKLNVAKIYLEPGDNFTATAASPVVGKRFVKIAPGGVGNHPRVAQAAAGDRAIGIAFSDAAANTDVLVSSQGVISVTAGEALAANDAVAVGADGKAVKVAASAPQVGTVFADTAANGDAPIKLKV